MAVTTSSGNGFALYNGVKLPKLPEWDKAAYPYAYIGDFGREFKEAGFTFNGDMYALAVSDQRPYHNHGTAITVRGPYNVKEAVLCTTQEAIDALAQLGIVVENIGVWSAWIDASASNTDDFKSVEYGLWANTDVINADGSLFLAASEPVPVGGGSGDDEGDTAPAPKHHGRVNGSVHEIEGGVARISGSYHEIEVGTVRIEGAYYEIAFDGSIGGDAGGDEGGGSLDGVIFQAGEGLLQGTVTATPNNPSFTTLISCSVTDSYITTKGGNAQQTVGGNTVYIPAFYALTIGPFDATDYDTLHVELTSNIGVIKCESGTDSVASGVITNSATAEEVTLDISGLSGECNVVISPSSNITSSTIFNATIYKIWLT